MSGMLKSTDLQNRHTHTFGTFGAILHNFAGEKTLVYGGCQKLFFPNPQIFLSANFRKGMKAMPTCAKNIIFYFYKKVEYS